MKVGLMKRFNLLLNPDTQRKLPLRGTCCVPVSFYKGNPHDFECSILSFRTAFFLYAPAQADTLKGPSDARELTNRVMAKVGAGDIEGGLKLAKPYLIIPNAEFDVMLEQFRLQQPAISQRFGKSIGYEFVREDKVGESVLRIIKIHKFEKHLMRWNFFFYKGKDGWVLNTFKTDDDIRQLFQ